MEIGINGKTILSSFYWYGIWLEKATLKPAYVSVRLVFNAYQRLRLYNAPKPAVADAPF